VSARTDWHVAELDLDDPLGDEPDPFAVPVEEIGEPIDLRDKWQRLNIRFTELLEQERRLFDRGVTCPVRDRSDTSCLGCPLSQASNTDHRLSPLCRVGREQERVTTALAIERLKFDPEDHA
jgi:hypothetical protein